MYIDNTAMFKDKSKTEKYHEKIIHEFKKYKENHVNYWDQYFDKNYNIISSIQESFPRNGSEAIIAMRGDRLRPHIKITPIFLEDVPLSKYIPIKHYIIIHVSEPQSVPFVGSILVCKMLQNTVIEKPHRQSCFLVGDNIVYNKKMLIDAVMRFSY